MPRRGYATFFDPDKARPVEIDTVCCVHCQSILFMHDMNGKRSTSDLGGFCTMCNGNTCGPCEAKGGCDPFMRKIEAQERSARLLDAVGVAR